MTDALTPQSNQGSDWVAPADSDFNPLPSEHHLGSVEHDLVPSEGLKSPVQTETFADLYGSLSAWQMHESFKSYRSFSSESESAVGRIETTLDAAVLEVSFSAALALVNEIAGEETGQTIVDSLSTHGNELITQKYADIYKRHQGADEKTGNHDVEITAQLKEWAKDLVDSELPEVKLGAARKIAELTNDLFTVSGYEKDWGLVARYLNDCVTSQDRSSGVVAIDQLIQQSHVNGPILEHLAADSVGALGLLDLKRSSSPEDFQLLLDSGSEGVKSDVNQILGDIHG